MYQTIKNQVMPDQTEAFTDFTNIKTIRSRLSHKKLISADFIDVVSGWFRAQYITVDQTLDGIPNVVIFTARNVDEEKKREEHLIRISMTDEMTRLFNRRCYDEDLKEFRKGELAENFALFSIDVNGLKKVNDTKGHAAGDELMAIIHTDDPEALRKTINEKAAGWHRSFPWCLWTAHCFCHFTASIISRTAAFISAFALSASSLEDCLV
ncbi:MAG: GGDEF domain-containing protein [Lachnospiraceae bacterium]|nr:GGDEF domain-containing protein [Lachnospiraceae bacterium]